ncbi:MAG: phosphoribosylanthranilate isomerase [Terriglobia bacterium]
MVKVKICGITNLEDAKRAVDLGADALGFNFYKKSPRYIEPSRAKLIIEELPPLVSTVGIFADEFSPERISSVARAVGLNAVQLHGSESPDYVKKVNELRVIKAFRVDRHFDLELLHQYAAGAYLLDTYDPEQLGGTGKVFDWDIAVAAKAYGRIILAGGLKPDNIVEAVSRVHPYAVDIGSGIESEPGKKDHDKMTALFRLVHQLRVES